MRRDPKLSTAEVADATAEGEAEIAGVTVVVVAAAVVVEAAIRSFLQGCRTILVGASGIATPPRWDDCGRRSGRVGSNELVCARASRKWHPWMPWIYLH